MQASEAIWHLLRRPCRLCLATSASDWEMAVCCRYESERLRKNHPVTRNDDACVIWLWNAPGKLTLILATLDVRWVDKGVM